MELYNGDCLEKLKDLSDNSVDIIIADPPYARFKHLEWDRKIDFEPLWEQLWRVSKPNTPIFLFADFKFALEIYNSQPKYFKYEIVWNKGSTTTPLLSRKRFGKCTEYILVFYKKQCVYNYAKYHKIIKTSKPKKTKKRAIMKHDSKMEINNTYEPKLPTNIIDCSFNNKKSDGIVNYERCMKGGARYKPTLPTNIIENEVIEKEKAIRDTWGKIIRYDNNYDPKLPLNIIDCSNEIITNYDPNHKKREKITMGDAWNGTIFKSFKNNYDPKLPLNIISNDTAMGADWCGGKCKRSLDVYEPRLPCNVIKCQTKRNKKIIKKLTEKPQFILDHLLKYFSNEGDTCLDFCMGSGSMGVACNTLNRKFIGIEKNKEFFEITKKRLTSPNTII